MMLNVYPHLITVKGLIHWPNKHAIQFSLAHLEIFKSRVAHHRAINSGHKIPELNSKKLNPLYIGDSMLGNTVS